MACRIELISWFHRLRGFLYGCCFHAAFAPSLLDPAEQILAQICPLSNPRPQPPSTIPPFPSVSPWLSGEFHCPLPHPCLFVSICGKFNGTLWLIGVYSTGGRPLSAKEPVTGRMPKQFDTTGWNLLKPCHDARSQSPLKRDWYLDLEKFSYENEGSTVFHFVFRMAACHCVVFCRVNFQIHNQKQQTHWEIYENYICLNFCGCVAFDGRLLNPTDCSTTGICRDCRTT